MSKISLFGGALGGNPVILKAKNKRLPLTSSEAIFLNTRIFFSNGKIGKRP